MEESEIKPKFHYLGNKAGVKGADDIKKKIETITKGSSYYQRQKEKAQMYADKVNAMKQQLELYKRDKSRVELAKQLAYEKSANYRKMITVDKVWLHLDMDMFYVACELLDKPELKEKPCAVGGMAMISTANYVARQFGVRSAMPGFVAKQLCPELVFLHHNFAKYSQISSIVMRILREYDPDLESMGLDEGNLDITQVLQEQNINILDVIIVPQRESEQIKKFCNEIRLKVNEASQLTASCGIGPNKMIAKLASEKNKPDGIHIVENDADKVMQFMAELPVRKVPGIGNVMEQILTGLGVNTCQDVRDKADEIMQVFTPTTFEFILGAAWGYGRNYHVEGDDPQSISCQRTFPAVTTPQEMETKIQELSESVAEDLEKQKMVARLVTLTLKTTKFEVRSKQMQLQEYIKGGPQIASYAKQLLKQMLPVEPLRLIGVRVAQLQLEDSIQKASIKTFFQKQSKPKIHVHDSDESFNCGEELIDDEGVRSISNQFTNVQSQKQNHVKRQTICPVCSKEVDCEGNLARLNRHIDHCLGLSNAESKQPASVEKPPSSSKPKKQKTTLDKFYQKKN